MLAGGINGADDLFPSGFTSLRALSPSGRSRPFHAEADGLVPSAGAALVAPQTVFADAERDGDRILGVIRGVGLFNDGRQSGILAPAASGRPPRCVMRLLQAGLNPADVDYIDRHATGTVLGDATELESLREAYGDAPSQTRCPQRQPRTHDHSVGGGEPGQRARRWKRARYRRRCATPRPRPWLTPRSRW